MKKKKKSETWADVERQFREDMAKDGELTPKQVSDLIHLHALAYVVRNFSRAISLQQEAEINAAQARQYYEDATTSLSELFEYMKTWEDMKDPRPATARLVRTLAQRLLDAQGERSVMDIEFVHSELLRMSEEKEVKE